MFAEKDSPPLDKQKEIFFKLVPERIESIEKLDNSIDFDNLTYHYKCPTANVDFNKFIDAATLFNKIKSKRIKLADAEKNQSNGI